MWFTIICGIVLIIVAGIFLSKTKKEKVKPEVINKEDRPVVIELFPKGTRANPLVCKVNSEVKLEVRGYSDYKKENEVVLNAGYCAWHKSCGVGSFAKEYGVTNTYYTPSIKGARDIWVRYNDGRLNTSSKCKLLVEVKK